MCVYASNMLLLYQYQHFRSNTPNTHRPSSLYYILLNITSNITYHFIYCFLLGMKYHIIKNFTSSKKIKSYFTNIVYVCGVFIIQLISVWDVSFHHIHFENIQYHIHFENIQPTFKKIILKS